MIGHVLYVVLEKSSSRRLIRMVLRELYDGIYSIRTIDWDKRKFDELFQTPRGTSYNSYFIDGGEKKALIDSTDPSRTSELLEDLDEIGVGLDYVISQHAEQDHAGAIPDLLEKYPNATVLGTLACGELLENLLRVPSKSFRSVKDKETLSLGKHQLKFVLTPWVHWPDTMVSYLETGKILFSCDFFGSHIATSKLSIEDKEELLPEAKRYYAHIMMPFASMVRKNLEKIREFEIAMIAPSHGPIISEPSLIIDAYDKWSNGGSHKVLIPYVSMHGSTKMMVEHLTDSLMKLGVEVCPFNLSGADMGDFVVELVDTSIMVVASPTVLTRAHPLVASALYLVNTLRPPIGYVGLIGSYGWGTRIELEIKDLLSNLNIQYLESILVKGLPGGSDFQRLDELAKKIHDKMR